MKLKIILILLLSVSFLLAQNSPFRKKLEYTNGSAATGLDVYLYDYDTVTKSYDLTETQPGVYYHASVAHGQYYLYVGGVNKGHLWHGTRQVSDFLDAVDADGDNKIDGAFTEDSSITRPKLSTTVNILLDAPGSGSSYSPDDETVEFKIYADTTIGVKSIGIVDEITTDTSDNKIIVKDGGVSWDKLSTAVQGRFAYGNLYDYQDSSVNNNLQMLVRYAHYLHENYYNEAQYINIYPYDLSGPQYERDRREIPRYLELLQVLHELTGRNIYWYAMLDLYEDMYNHATEEITYKGGGKTCLSLQIDPDAPDEWDSWTFSDVRFHLVGRYIYEQDNSYSAYNTAFKDFVDVFVSYVDKDTYSEGWGFGYHWDTNAMAGAGLDRINTCAPALPLFVYCDVNTITTDSVSAALIDSLIDSTYALIDAQWVDDPTYGSGGGGYPTFTGGSTIDYSYNGVYIYEFGRATSIKGDTTWASNVGDRMKKMALYHLKYNTFNLVGMGFNAYSWMNTYLKKFCDKYNLDYDSPKFSQFVVATTKAMTPFNGRSFPTIEPERWYRSSALWVTWIANYIRDFNDDAWSESYYTHGANEGTWAYNAGSYYYVDGTLSTEKYYVGLMEGDPAFAIGYRHEDTSPVPTDDTLTWVISNNILSYDVENIDKGSGDLRFVDYDVKKRLGSPYKWVSPDTNGVTVGDSIWYLVPIPGTANSDSVWFFYYNMDGVIDTLKNTTLSVGDSLVFRGDLGILGTVCRNTAPAEGGIYAGLICSETRAVLHVLRDLGAYRYFSMNTTKPDSAIFVNGNHASNNMFLHLTADWPDAIDFMTKQLSNLQDIWDNGMEYEGILEDKLQ